jgi:cyclophilin family peptidyl-prolyl cis-trans isomerase
LDGKHVVFGAVKSGLDVLKAIEKNGSESGKPKQVVSIRDSGELK